MFIQENKPKFIFPTVDFVFICHSDIRTFGQNFVALKTERVDGKSCPVGPVQQSLWLSPLCICTIANGALQHNPIY